MGGNAIKMSERIPKEKFFEYASIIKPLIEKAFDTKVHMVTSFKNKEDFGDLDLLVLENHNFDNRVKIVEDLFSPEETDKNSHIYSFNYENLQVDLIFTPEENWETSKIFFQHGDLGNLMGKIINNYGHLANHDIHLKYGYDGLKVKFLYKGNSKNVFITKDNKKVFEFLGLDFTKWEEGFNDKYEMFDYVVKAYYFDYNAFQWDNLNHINKKRNARRPNYIEFLEYIENHRNYVEYAPVSSIYLSRLKEFFNVDIQSEFDKFKSDININKEVSEKFNGKLVMEVMPYLKGKELGDALKGFKESKNDWNDFILNNNIYFITENFKEWYNGVR